MNNLEIPKDNPMTILNCNLAAAESCETELESAAK